MAAPPPPPPKATSLRAKVLFDYRPNTAKEMALRAGDIIDIVKRGDAGGWSVGKLGAFPTDYVQFLTPPSTAAPVMSSKPDDDPFANIDTTPAPVVQQQPTPQVTAGAASAVPASVAVSEKPKPTFAPPVAAKQEPVAKPSAAISSLPEPEYVSSPPPLLSSATSQPTAAVRSDFKNRVWTPFSTPDITAAPLTGTACAVTYNGQSSSSPVWRNYMFMDLMADAYIDQMIKPERYASTPATTRMKQSLHLLQAALTYSRVDTSLPQKTSDMINILITACNEAEGMCDLLPHHTTDPNRIYSFIEKFVGRVRSLQTNDVLLAPIVWPGTSIKSDHAVLLVLVKHDVDFSLCVINTRFGEGLQYHTMKADPTDASILYNTSLVINSIPINKMHNTGFWFLCFVSAIQPSDRFSCDFFYERLLPFLARKPLLADFSEQNACFRALPLGGDFSFVHTGMEAIKQISRMFGFSAPDARYVEYLCVWSILRFVKNDLQTVQNIASGEVDLLRISVRAVSLAASDVCKDESNAEYSQLSSVQVCLEEVESRIHALSASELKPPRFDLNRDESVSNVCDWSWFGRLSRDAGVEHLAGEAPMPKITRPVELTLVPDKITNFTEAANALRHAVHLCVLLANQKDLIKNSYTLRFCLIEHLFVRVIPIPLPLEHPERDKKCFWHAQPMRHETQADFLKLLNLLAKHFSVAALSVKYTRSGDAARILTISCMAAVADSLMRKIASDIPSHYSLHYAGKAPGPIKPFGFEMGKFAIESEFLQFNTPETAAARTQILDYFTHVKKAVDVEHMLFRFERMNECSTGDLQFINQLSLYSGFDTQFAGEYITGERPEILENYPEVGYFRDIVFLFKLVMVPSSDSLPEVRPWDIIDGSLRWSVKNNVYSVYGFKRKLECLYPDIDDDDSVISQKLPSRGLFSRLWRFIGLTAKPRTLPSKANPSILAGEQIDTEDDVLHIRTLPSFDDTMGARDAELMLQYLTAPYLRIPLLLNFFSSEKRLKCLRVTEIQEILDSALFEPGRWQEELEKIAPEMVPAPSRDHLSTPAGLLFNEIIMSPNVILSSIKDMLEKVIDLDTGRYSEVSESILYIVRLAIRVEGYLLFLVKNFEYNDKNQLYQGAYTDARVRGLDIDQEAINEALQCQKSLRLVMDEKIFKIIARWIKLAKQEGQMLLACKLHAHLAFLYRNVEYPVLNSRIVFSILASQIFLFNNYTFDVELDAQKSFSLFSRKEQEDIKNDLSISQVELFDMFQRNRRTLLAWLDCNPQERNEVMDAIVQMVEEGKKNKEEAELAHIARNWVPVDRAGYAGKFVPDNEVPDFEGTLSDVAKIDYEAWLRETTTVAIETEMNVQLGEFTIRRHLINPLENRIVQCDDFLSVFADLTRDDIIQCAEIKHTTQRSWVRLVGMGFDVQYWTPDPRTPDHGMSPFPFDPCSAQWVKDILEPWKDVLTGLQLFATSNDLNNKDVAILYCHVALPGVAIPPKESKEEPQRLLKEIIVYRSTRVFHVFNVISHGRRFYRSQIFTSDVNYTLHDLPLGKGLYINNTYVQGAGDVSVTVPPSSSLVILRALSDEEVDARFQMYIPQVLLLGLMPSALLNQYMFWQNPDDTLIGYMPADKFSGLAMSILQVKIEKDVSRIDKSGNGNTFASGSISRTYVMDTTSKFSINFDIVVDATKPTLYLINLMQYLRNSDHMASTTQSSGMLLGFNKKRSVNDAPSPAANIPSVLQQFVQLLLRLDSLSSILAWSKTNPTGSTAVSIDLIELPRLRLTFEKKVIADGTVRYMCLEQSGLYLAQYSEQLKIDHILDGLPHAVLLTNSESEYFVLLPATAKPSIVKVKGDMFSYQLTLNRMDESWVENTGESAYFVYPIHSSGGFLCSRSIGSTLYLLLFRTLMRKYSDAYKLIETCICDTVLTPQEQQFFDTFGIIADTLYPEIHALRLKLYFITYGFQDVMVYPFDIRKEMYRYLQKLKYINCECHLTWEEEAFILKRIAEICGSNGESNHYLFTNRYNLIKASFNLFLEKFSPKSKDNIFRVTYPTHNVKSSVIDTPVNMEVLDTSKPNFKTWIGKFAIAKYNRPEELSGAPAIAYLLSILQEGALDLRGKIGGLGFFFLYELMNNTLAIRILHDDSPHVLGAALLRTLSEDAVAAAQGFTGQCQSYVILKIMSEHIELAMGMPNFEDKRKLKLPSLAGLDIFQTHIKNAASHLKSHQGAIDPNRLGFHSAKLDPPKAVYGSPTPEDDPNNFNVGRCWVSPRITDLNCASREFSQSLPKLFEKMSRYINGSDIEAFATTPLQVLGLNKYVSFLSRSARKTPPVSGASPLEVLQHPSSRSHIARTSVKRLEKDIDDYARDENVALTPVLISVADNNFVPTSAISNIEDLIDGLHALKRKDKEFIVAGIDEVVKCVNGYGHLRELRKRDMSIIGHQFAQHSGLEALLVRLLLNCV